MSVFRKPLKPRFWAARVAFVGAFVFGIVGACFGQPAKSLEAATPAAAVEPTPSPTPSPTPAPTPPPLRFLPPFSLNDCIDLLDQAHEVFPDPKNLKATDKDSINRLLETVSEYLTTRDEMHSTLIGYEWERIARVKVKDALIKDSEFEWEGVEVPRGVNALSFEVIRGDVMLYGLRVYADSGSEPVMEFPRLNREPTMLRHSLPRREVFHLWRPTDIRRVEVACALVDPKVTEYPKVYIRAGRTKDPEHGKSAIFYINRCQQRLQAGEVEKAAEDLSNARSEVRLYRQSIEHSR